MSVGGEKKRAKPISHSLPNVEIPARRRSEFNELDTRSPSGTSMSLSATLTAESPKYDKTGTGDS